MSARSWIRSAAVLVTCLLLGITSFAPAAPSVREWDGVVDKAINYLKASQAGDGSWSREKSPGVTGVALTGLLSTGKVGPDDPVSANALKYIESLINTKAGHIAGKDAHVQLQNYVTSINVMALQAANRDERYKKVIGDAAEFLKRLQWDEEEGKGPNDDFYGGAGYDSKSRPDLSNTQFFLDALKAAGVSKDDPAYKKALVFVSRCQNLKGEHNDQTWAGKINDGSFVYSAAGGGQTKSDTLPGGGLVGYGSMTYAGIKSMIYCGVSKDDPRVQKAYEWIQKHYTVEENPGMPRPHAQWGLYYYYHTMAKCLSLLGVDEVVDAHGAKHDWRADITAALARRQRPDGSWVNENHWLEADPNLVTGYALMALSYCKPRK
ncbi:MAG TPA: prenyltransferase/squalene oxidase repeat-containing protein [Gemmataceae bacterium]|jgi:squalene-hopene/tetraprenyl-beta-curcumene cyclase|nr:prenyltransferase/squalene oxidase repeat-containing protein [Gemmataceae bacterium]